MTRKRNVLWMGIGLGFAMAIGPLVVFQALKPDPEAIQADLGKRIAMLEALPAREALRRDALAEDLLAVEEYRSYARSLWLKLERLHPSLHEAARIDRAAQKEVLPLLARCKDAGKLPRAQLQALYDEVRANLDTYGVTRFGDPLRDAEQCLKAAIESATVPCWNLFFALSRDAQKTAAEGHFAAAIRLVGEFQKEISDDPSLDLQIDKLLALIRRKAKGAAEAIHLKARELAAAGRTTEAIQLIDRTSPDLQGLREAEPLEAYRRSITPR